MLEPGAVHEGKKESSLTIGLRDAVVPKLQAAGYTVEVVPDTLNLRSSIAWVNQRATKDDLAFSFHFNWSNDHSVRGTEVFYSNKREGELAAICARHVAEALGFPNRGARPDTWTWVGQLGWLRQLKCDSVLIEVAYMTNDSDMRDYSPQRAADGFLAAMKEIAPRKLELSDLRKQLSLAERLVADLIEQFNRLFKRV